MCREFDDETRRKITVMLAALRECTRTQRCFELNANLGNMFGVTVLTCGHLAGVSMLNFANEL